MENNLPRPEIDKPWAVEAGAALSHIAKVTKLTRLAAAAVVLALAGSLHPRAVIAQDAAPDAAQDSVPESVPDTVPNPVPPPKKVESPWSGSLQGNGSAFFGNNIQRVFGGRGTLSRSDSLLEVEARAEVVYGESEAADAARYVTKRALLGTFSADYRPKGMLSPFITVTVESNLEKKIDTRYSIGVGANRTLIRTPRTQSSLSVALMDEQTVPMVAPGAQPTPSTQITRWSVRGRLNHAFDDRLRMSHTTFYQPNAQTNTNYLLRSTSDAEYALTKVVAFTTSMVFNYDSEATIRGARVNHDGQVLFGIKARW